MKVWVTQTCIFRGILREKHEILDVLDSEYSERKHIFKKFDDVQENAENIKNHEMVSIVKEEIEKALNEYKAKIKESVEESVEDVFDEEDAEEEE